MSSYGRLISGLFATIFLILAVCGVCAADSQIITLEKRKEIVAPDRTLPDGSHLRGKIIEIITGSNSNCYLIQYNSAYALVSQGDIVQKI